MAHKKLNTIIASTESNATSMSSEYGASVTSSTSSMSSTSSTSSTSSASGASSESGASDASSMSDISGVSSASGASGTSGMSGESAGRGRVWQIDALRGTAMVLMTVFHALVDVRDFFKFADVHYYEPPLMYIGRISAILFMFVSGISCRFSKNNIKRGIKVILCGMIITAVTFIAVREQYIRFGILHFLGAAFVIIGLFERVITKEKTKQAVMWVASPLSLFIGRVFSQMQTKLPFLLIFGITTAGFVSYDYYPIFPWIGVVFAGYAAGGFVVNNRKKLASMRKARIFSAFCALGKVSLIYYLLHQPALFALFFIIAKLFRIPLDL